MKSVNIHDGIESTLQLLQHRLKGCSAHPQIRVKKEYSSLPLVDCYPGQLNQVFMNLLSNAIDSLTEEAGGRNSATLPTITICTEVKNCNDSRSNTLSQLSDASCVVIRITDNGSGIPQEMQKRIFDPFFSTKPIGKGTGLGLSISQSIVVEKHKGRLTCYSTVGKGTEFVIELPIRREVPNRSQINCGNCQFGNRLLMAQQRLKPSC